MATTALFHPRLSTLERRLLVLAAAGWGRPEIALLTDLGEDDVERRLGGVQDKLGAESLEDAVARAAGLGLVRPALQPA